MPPDASRRARPAVVGHGPAQRVRGHVVEQHHVSAPASSASSQLGERVDLDLDGDARDAPTRTRSHRGRHAAGHRHVVVLDQHGVVQAGRGGWRRRRRRRRACRARAGRARSCACPAARRRCRRRRRRSARVVVAMPDIRCSRLSAVRSPVSSARSEASHAWPPPPAARLRQRRRRPRARSIASRRGRAAGAPRTRWSRPQTTPGSRTTTSARPRASAGTIASVVTSPPPTSSARARAIRLSGLGRARHAGGRGRGLSAGKSSRTCAPRLSRRWSAAAAISRCATARVGGGLVVEPAPAARASPAASRSRAGVAATSGGATPPAARRPADAVAASRLDVEPARRPARRRPRGRREDEALEQRVRRQPVGAVHAAATRTRRTA